MMASNDDNLGCVFFAIIAAVGVWYFWDRYEIRQRNVVAEVKPAPLRLSGLLDVATLENGSIWRLDADAVMGPRTSRQAWIVADHSANRTQAARETKTLYRINCETAAYRTLTIIDYDKDGKVTKSWTEEEFDKNDRYAPPDTNISSVVDYACLEAFDTPKDATKETDFAK